jgi:hypothetical protein
LQSCLVTIRLRETIDGEAAVPELNLPAKKCDTLYTNPKRKRR